MNHVRPKKKFIDLIEIEIGRVPSNISQNYCENAVKWSQNQSFKTFKSENGWRITRRIPQP